MTDSAAISTKTKHRTVALVGNPNTGKSTLFNVLTGFRQHVGNFPGVTVDKRSGLIRNVEGADSIELIDMPGTYSLAAQAEDEAIVLNVVLGQAGAAGEPDLVLVVVDASNLSRNLFFTSQILELGRPAVVALNMVDVAERSGVRIDADLLGRELGVPVIPIVATRKTGIEALRRAVVDSLDAAPSNHCAVFPHCVCAELDGLTDSLREKSEEAGDCPSRAQVLQTLLDPGGYHERELIKRCGLSVAQELSERRGRIQAAGESIVEVEARVRYAWIDRVVSQVSTETRARRPSRSEAADRFLTHRVYGMLFFLFVMGMVFQSIYTWAAPLMELIDGAFAHLGGMLHAVMPEGALRSLVVDGAVAGVGAVLVFLPQILILFLFVAILEDCGYMARSAFLLDRWMGLMGLTGKSFIPLLSSFACAVPGIMATRTIEDRRDRLVTILIAPLMSCSARLPVYVLLIGAFIPATPLLGGLMNLQAVTLLGFYFVGVAVAIPVAVLLKKTVLKGGRQSFLMELPTYKWPSWQTVFHRVYGQGREFCVSAGTIIFAVAIIVWAMGYYPHPASIAATHEAERVSLRVAHVDVLTEIAEAYDPSLSADTVARAGPVAAALLGMREIEDGWSAAAGGGIEPDSDERLAEFVAASGPAGTAARRIRTAERALETRLAEVRQHESGTYLRGSLLGHLGHWIEPVVKPLGWDWRIGTAAIASFPAREVIVATMSTIYNLGGDQSETSVGIREKLRAARWPDGRPVYNTAVALSLMVFFALCCQCGATLATIKRETRSWRWPIFTFTYMTVLAYLGALATYQVAIRLI